MQFAGSAGNIAAGALQFRQIHFMFSFSFLAAILETEQRSQLILQHVLAASRSGLAERQGCGSAFISSGSGSSILG
jgi:hypothetical protein